MRTRTANRLVWISFGLTFAFIAAGLVLVYLNDFSSLLSGAFSALVISAYAIVGLLIASRRQENRLGWVIVIGTLLTAIADWALEYAVYGSVTAPGALPIPLWIAILGGWFRSVGFILILYVVLLLFPDGHLPSPRWRMAVWLLVLSATVQSLDAIFSWDFSDIDSRLGSLPKPTSNILPAVVGGMIGGLTILCWSTSVLACLGAIVVRFRRSKGGLAGPAGEAGWGLITIFLPLLFPAGRLLSRRWRSYRNGTKCIYLCSSSTPPGGGVQGLRVHQPGEGVP